MVRKASEEYAQWRQAVLASPWVTEVTGEVQCRALAGYVPVRLRGSLEAIEKYRCTKLAHYRLKAVTTRSMLIIDAVSGNYCPSHLIRQIEDHDGERVRFEKWIAKYEEKKSQKKAS